MISRNNRTPPLGYIKICALFQSQQWIQTGATVQKHSIQVKIGDFLSCLTLKFDERLWKTIGHLFSVTSSFVHHFIAICQIKLDLQSGNVKFGWKSVIFCPVWPWNLTDDLKNNRAPFLCYFKLCALFFAIDQFKLELQSGNAKFGSKSVIFCPMWPWNLTNDLEKQ